MSGNKKPPASGGRTKDSRRVLSREGEQGALLLFSVSIEDFIDLFDRHNLNRTSIDLDETPEYAAGPLLRTNCRECFGIVGAIEWREGNLDTGFNLLQPTGDQLTNLR